jgi:nucleotide-binding universal stress UspA family protein
MRDIKSVLLGTDFRPASRSAAQVAMHLSWFFGSRIDLLHVESLPHTWPLGWHEYRTHAEKRLESEIAVMGREGVAVHSLAIQVGSPADVIVRKSDELHSDLILIGAGEMGKDGRFQVGPVAQAVLQRSRHPVLAVHPAERLPTFRRILCPVDHSHVSRQGLENAIRLAKAFGGELVVLSVIPSMRWLDLVVETGRLGGAMDEHSRKWTAEFDDFLRPVDFADVRWRKEIRGGEPHEEICKAARADDADVIVMGSTGRTGLARLILGSVTRRVLGDLPCSILVVKEEDVLASVDDEEARQVSLLFAEARSLLEGAAPDLALAKLDQVLARNPYHVPALESRAKVLEQLGRKEQAARCRRRLMLLQAEGLA